MPVLARKERLKEELGLFDVYVICTGAMISSGFFLLPGLAAAQSGPSVVLAYFLAGVLVLPAMFSKAELATAMPRAGGTYYFLDRSMGPLVGTIAGFGTWLALILKSGFALVGMGAYLVIFLDLPIHQVALALTVLFAVLNIIGARQTSGVQRVLVVTLLSVLAFFLVQGSFETASFGFGTVARERWSPFLPFGLSGLFSTVGFVFVSYAGLTKVASVAEEVSDPDRNIPLGMILSLATATFVYVVGVAIMVSVLDPQELRSDLTPVATAAQSFFDWLPGSIGLFLIVIAAIAAFASTGNAGLLSASRYPLAMARDHLIHGGFARLGRFHTPTAAILATAGLMMLFIVTLDVERIAKLASSFQLLLFSMLNLAVIVMRESRIEGYRPGFSSPLYPWMQIVGFAVPIWLIVELGWFPFLFTLAVIALSAAWYRLYGLEDLAREGAIYHVFERLGRYRYTGLERELRQILDEKEIREIDPFEEVVAQAAVIDLAEPKPLDEIIEIAAAQLAEDLHLAPESLVAGLRDRIAEGTTPITRGAAFPHLRLNGIQHPRMTIVRSRPGTPLTLAGQSGADGDPIHAIFFLASPGAGTGAHLRILGRLAGRVDESGFVSDWLSAQGPQGLKQLLLRHEHSLALRIRPDTPTAELAGRRVREIELPAGTLIAVIRRDRNSIIPRGDTELRMGDRVTIIGDPEGMHRLQERFTTR